MIPRCDGRVGTCLGTGPSVFLDDSSYLIQAQLSPQQDFYFAATNCETLFIRTPTVSKQQKYQPPSGCNLGGKVASFRVIYFRLHSYKAE